MNFVPYRPVQLVFVILVTWSVQKHSNFVPVQISAISGSFRMYRDKYRNPTGTVNVYQTYTKVTNQKHSLNVTLVLRNWLAVSDCTGDSLGCETRLRAWNWDWEKNSFEIWNWELWERERERVFYLKIGGAVIFWVLLSPSLTN